MEIDEQAVNWADVNIVVEEVAAPDNSMSLEDL